MMTLEQLRSLQSEYNKKGVHGIAKENQDNKANANKQLSETSNELAKMIEANKPKVVEPKKEPFMPDPVASKMLKGTQWDGTPLKKTVTPSLPPKLDNIARNIVSFGLGTADTLTMGLQPLNDKLSNPDNYAKQKAVEESAPKSNFLGKLAGYILPGAVGTNLVGKSLAKPLLNKFSKDAIGQVAKAGVQEAIVGSGMGAVEGLTGGLREDKKGLDLAKNVGMNTLYGGALGFGLGGGAVGAGKLVSGTKNMINNKVNSSFDEIFGGYRPSIEGNSPLMSNVGDLSDISNVTAFRPSQVKALPMSQVELRQRQVMDLYNSPKGTNTAMDGYPQGYPLKTTPTQVRLPERKSPLALKAGTFEQPPARPVTLGEAPKGKFGLKADNVKEPKNNKIKRLYHGGNIDPKKYDITKASQEAELGSGFYAVEGKGYAEEFADMRGGKVYDVDIDTTNFFDEFNIDKNDDRYQKLIDLLVNEGGLRKEFVSENFGGAGTLNFFANILGKKSPKNNPTMFPGGSKIKELIQKSGFDGAIAEARDTKQYVSFNSKNNIMTPNISKISEFTPKNKTTEPIRQYNQQMKQISNRGNVEPNFAKETPFRATPAEISKAVEPPKVLPQFSREVFPSKKNKNRFTPTQEKIFNKGIKKFESSIRDGINEINVTAKNKSNTKSKANINDSRGVKSQGNINSPTNKTSALNEQINANDIKVKLDNHSSNEKPFPKAVEKPRIVSSDTGKKKTVSERWNETQRKWIDSNVDIKPVSGEAYVKATNAKKVGGTTSYIFNDGLVDANGKQVGQSVKSLIKSIPQGKEEDFLEYMLMKHNSDRYALNKPIYSMYDVRQSLDKADELLKANPEFKQSEKEFRKFIDTFGDEWLVNSGLVSRESMDNMRSLYDNYMPTNRLFSEVETASSKGAKSGFVNQPNTIKGATGSNRDIINPVENIMTMVNKVVRTARRNEVGQAIVKAVQDEPAKLSKYVEILPTTKAEKEAMESALKEHGIDELIDEEGAFIHPAFMPQKPNVVTVLVDGKPVYLKIKDKNFLEAMNGVTSNVADINPKLRVFNEIYKGLITQKNPFFAIRNIARDIPTSYIYGSEKNPFKFLYDLGKASKDIATNSDNYKQYKALGGGDAQFFNPENVTKYKEALTNKPNILKRVVKGIEWFNAVTETAPRLAEFERTLAKTGGNTQQALYNAGEVTTNFSRGGKSAKTVDSVVPYFNAGMQGLDRMARGIKKNPVGFALKGLTSVTVPTLALHMINKDNPYYQQLDDRTKDNNYLIHTGDGKFIKIPKSRETGVIFGSLFERILRGNFENFGTTVATNFSPANPLDSNIFSPLLNLARNKDFADRTIVPKSMESLSPQYQYDEKTSEIAKKIGEIANLSPKQIDYLIKSYTGVIGQIIQPATTGGDSKVLDTLVTRPFTADVAYSNKPTDTFYKNIEKLKTIAKDKNIIENIPSKDLTEEEEYANAFNSVSNNLSKLKKNIQRLPDKNMQRQEQLKLMQTLDRMNKALAQKDLGTIRNIADDIKKTVKD